MTDKYDIVILRGSDLKVLWKDISAQIKEFQDKGIKVLCMGDGTRELSPSEIKKELSGKVDENTRTFLFGHGVVTAAGHTINLISGIGKTGDAVDFLADFGIRNFDILACHAGACISDITREDLNVVAHADNNYAYAGILLSIMRALVMRECMTERDSRYTKYEENFLSQIATHLASPVSFSLRGKQLAVKPHQVLSHYCSEDTLKRFFQYMLKNILGFLGVEKIPDFSESDIRLLVRNYLLWHLFEYTDSLVSFITNPDNVKKVSELISVFEEEPDAGLKINFLSTLIYNEKAQEVVDILYQHGAKIDASEKYPAVLSGAGGPVANILIVSVIYRLDMVDMCIAAGINVDEKGPYGRSALMIAVCEENLMLVKKILTHDPDLYQKDDQNEDVLQMAVRSCVNKSKDKIEILMLLLEKIDPALFDENSYNDALKMVLSHAVISDSLFEKLGQGFRDGNGNTLLMLCCVRSSHAKSLGKLLKLQQGSMRKDEIQALFNHALKNNNAIAISELFHFVESDDYDLDGILKCLMGSGFRVPDKILFKNPEKSFMMACETMHMQSLRVLFQSSDVRLGTAKHEMDAVIDSSDANLILEFLKYRFDQVALAADQLRLILALLSININADMLDPGYFRNMSENDKVKCLIEGLKSMQSPDVINKMLTECQINPNEVMGSGQRAITALIVACQKKSASALQLLEYCNAETINFKHAKHGSALSIAIKSYPVSIVLIEKILEKGASISQKDFDDACNILEKKDEVLNALSKKIRPDLEVMITVEVASRFNMLELLKLNQKQIKTLVLIEGSYPELKADELLKMSEKSQSAKLTPKM